MPERHSFFRRLCGQIVRLAADRAEDTAARAADKARQAARDVVNGGRFTCSCGGKSCPGNFRSSRALKAHAAKVTGQRWMSAKARAVEKKMGKVWSDARRHARGWKEAAGLTDPRGRATAKGRSRPPVSGRVKLGDLRQAHRHDRHHEKAAARDHKATQHKDRAARHQGKAEARTGQGKTAGRHGRRQERHETRAQRHQDKAQSLRGRWPEQPRPPRPAQAASRPAPKTRASSNGTRPAAKATPARPAQSVPARPGGRLAPQPRANGNDHRPAPVRTRT
jgi:hypothetical protein